MSEETKVTTDAEAKSVEKVAKTVPEKAPTPPVKETTVAPKREASGWETAVEEAIWENQALVRRLPVEVVIHIGRGTPSAKEIRCGELSAKVKNMVMETK